MNWLRPGQTESTYIAVPCVFTAPASACASPHVLFIYFYPKALALIATIEWLGWQGELWDNKVSVWLVTWIMLNSTSQLLPGAMSVEPSRNIFSLIDFFFLISIKPGLGTQQVWNDASILWSQKKRLRIESILTQFIGQSAIEVTEQATEVFALWKLFRTRDLGQWTTNGASGQVKGSPFQPLLIEQLLWIAGQTKIFTFC